MHREQGIHTSGSSGHSAGCGAGVGETETEDQVCLQRARPRPGLRQGGGPRRERGGPAPPAHAASRKAIAGLLGPAANPNTQPARPLQDTGPPTQRLLSPRTHSRAWALGQKGRCRWVVVLGRSRGRSPSPLLPPAAGRIAAPPGTSAHRSETKRGWGLSAHPVQSCHPKPPGAPESRLHPPSSVPGW